jgi:hypothetical protein
MHDEELELTAEQISRCILTVIFLLQFFKPKTPNSVLRIIHDLEIEYPISNHKWENNVHFGIDGVILLNSIFRCVQDLAVVSSWFEQFGKSPDEHPQC